LPQIDALLQSLSKFGAQGALLSSGEKVQLVFPTGKRYASQTTPHAALVKLVEEIVPPTTTLNRNGGTTFVYSHNGSQVVIRVDASISSWKVSIEPKPGEPAEAVAPAAGPAAAASQPAGAASSASASAGAAGAPAGPPPGVHPMPIPQPVVRKPRLTHVQTDSAIEKLLLRMLEMGASDLHLASGARPAVRIHGSIEMLSDAPVMSEDELLARLYEITPPRNRE